MKQSTSNDQDNTEAVSAIVQFLKAQGIFDQFRKECLEDVDTKPSYHNLRQRMDGYVEKFLSGKTWDRSVNKNQLREELRSEITNAHKNSVDHLVDLIVSSRANTHILMRVESVVKEYLGIKDETESEHKDSKDHLEKSSGKNIDNQIKQEHHKEPLSTPKEHNLPINSSSKFKSTFVEVPQETKSTKPSSPIRQNYQYSASDENLSSLPDKTKKEKSPDSSNFSDDDSLPSAPPLSASNSPIHVPSSFSLNAKDHGDSRDSTSLEMDRPSLHTNPISNLDDALSDVSSVHTSDLSNFDDRISLTSGDEEERKISLRVVKEMIEGNMRMRKERISDDDIRDSIKSKNIRESETGSENSRSSSGRIEIEKMKTKFEKRNEREKDSKDDRSRKVDKTNSRLRSGDSGKASRESSNPNTSMSRDSPTPSSSEKKKLKKQTTHKKRTEIKSQQRYDKSDLYKPRFVTSSRRNRSSTRYPQ